MRVGNMIRLADTKTKQNKTKQNNQLINLQTQKLGSIIEIKITEYSVGN